MPTRRIFLFSLFAIAGAVPAFAQFTGPSVEGAPTTVANALNARPGTYVTIDGNIVAHLREDYYQFSDGSAEIRIEIPRETFGGQQVGPQTRVRIMGEVDQSMSGRYVWVKSLSLI